MATDEATYTLDNTWEKAHKRLTLLEQVFDPWSIPRLTALGVGKGWRCLEVGAGAGSITRWLCDRVGPTGQVVAVDLEPRFLEADPRPNLEIHRRDVVADGIPGDGYDLIHTRAVLAHLPNRNELIAELVGHLRPGGLVLFEEPDCYPFSTADSPTYIDVWDAAIAVAAKAGGDWSWAHILPSVLAEAGAADVTAAVDSGIYRGGSPWAECIAISWEQLTPLLLDQGVAPALIANGIEELREPDRWFPCCAMIAASGYRPS